VHEAVYQMVQKLHKGSSMGPRMYGKKTEFYRIKASTSVQRCCRLLTEIFLAELAFRHWFCLIEERQLIFLTKLLYSDNFILRTLACRFSVRCEMLGVASKYGLSAVQTSIKSVVKDVM